MCCRCFSKWRVLAALLNRRHLKELSLHRIELEDKARDIPVICDALKKSVSLNSLGLQCLPDELTETCLDTLSGSSSMIEQLTLVPGEKFFSVSVANSLKRFIKSNASLRRLRFGDSEFGNSNSTANRFYLSQKLCLELRM